MTLSSARGRLFIPRGRELEAQPFDCATWTGWKPRAQCVQRPPIGSFGGFVGWGTSLR
jgi:hypothetical protein